MRIQYQQLAANLERGPAPVYLVCGDEPLQLGEAAGMVRQAARRHGFEERELLEADANFDWGRLIEAAQALSLFCTRKLIELRLSGARIGRDGGGAVSGYCERPAPDNLLLIIAPALEYKELKAKWVQAVERAGVLVQVRQIEGRQLPAWIEQRLRGQGLVPGPGVAALIAERVEGNLLAAAQEVEKLSLLYGEGPLDAERLGRAIADSSRFDLFDVPAAALAGDRLRMHRVLDGLAAEGVAPALALWAMARELRMLAEASFAARQGGAAFNAVLDAHRVWESRRAPVRVLLKRLPLVRLQGLLVGCAAVDRQIKGLEPGDPWRALARIGDELAGGEPARQ
jgi:DNA polymerase-3 subunit delta